MDIHLSGFALPRRDGETCEDAWAGRQQESVTVAAVADGISASHQGGEAARRAVEMIVEYCLARPRTWSPRRALAEFVRQINRHLYTESIERNGTAELGCTLTALIVEGARLYGCNVGDTTAFHWRRGRLQRLSEIHTLTAPGFDHVLTRALGLEATVDPFLFEIELMEGDRVLLCSDGVTHLVPDDRLGEQLSRRATARSIVSSARIAGEEIPDVRDDMSAVVLDVIDLHDATAADRQRLEICGALQAGDVIDGHRLIRPLGDNDRVWLAEQPEHRRVVLKFPPREAAEVEVLRDAFVREAWNATRLASPDLVRAWTPDTPALHCYAMEYLDAPNLRTVLRQGRLRVEETQKLGEFLVRVGEFLLAHDLAHGDIKPDNIAVLRASGAITLRMLDLGSAAELFSVRSRAGTPSYLAPERFRGAAISERTEIFAIGVTLYEALCGAFPYGEVERFQTPRFEHLPPAISRLNPTVPAWLNSLILRALEADPERRYQHFSEISFDLSHPDTVAPHHRKNAPLLERNPLLFFKALCAVLALVVVVLLAVIARR